MNAAFLFAAFLSLCAAAIHVAVGGKYIAAPLLAARSLRPTVRYTHYYCWHMATIAIVMMAAGFGYAALAKEKGQALAYFAVFQALAFMLWNVGLNLWRRLSFWRHPQWGLFLAVVSAGAAGL